MDKVAVLARLKSHANPANVAGMARYGINPKNTLGVGIPVLRALAREIGKDHALAQEIWKSGIHEARILAGMIDSPAQVTPRQMDSWAREFDSWDVCDQVCANLFRHTAFAFEKCEEWSGRPQEFVKRAGFALMAALTVVDKQTGDERFLAFLPIIEREAGDGRNFVKKAVNWALRQIGKRNSNLNRAALETARRLLESPDKSARWIASDAIKELTGPAVQKRLGLGGTDMEERGEEL